MIVRGTAYDSPSSQSWNRSLKLYAAVLNCPILNWQAKSGETNALKGERHFLPEVAVDFC
jgi:hypothetical protein